MWSHATGRYQVFGKDLWFIFSFLYLFLFCSAEPAREINSKKEIWCRNLFEAGQNSADVSPPPTGSRKRKLFRRYSELTTSVKDTPARKQKRHFFWKRQHKERWYMSFYKLFFIILYFVIFLYFLLGVLISVS